MSAEDLKEDRIEHLAQAGAVLGGGVLPPETALSTAEALVTDPNTDTYAAVETRVEALREKAEASGQEDLAERLQQIGDAYRVLDMAAKRAEEELGDDFLDKAA